MLESTLRLPKPRSKNPLLSAFRSVWTAPTTLLGHALGRLVTRNQPRRIEAPAASAWLYLSGRSSKLKLSALTIGHVIIAREDRLAGFEGKLILAHELAHTRQHDWLGPWYLPAHVVCELVSSLVATFKRAPVFSKVHAYNPLEQTFICIGAGACRPLAAGDIKAPFALSELLTAFGIASDERVATEDAGGGDIWPHSISRTNP